MIDHNFYNYWAVLKDECPYSAAIVVMPNGKILEFRDLEKDSSKYPENRFASIITGQETLKDFEKIDDAFHAGVRNYRSFQYLQGLIARARTKIRDWRMKDGVFISDAVWAGDC